MKRVFLALAIVVGMASVANAQVITRDGSDFNGAANPGGCVIMVHDNQPTELHVNCKHSDAPARIRYRYLKPIIKGPAEFGGTVVKHGGTGTVSDVRWMADPDAPRTGRVVIPAGFYGHIVKVRWVRD